MNVRRCHGPGLVLGAALAALLPARAGLADQIRLRPSQGTGVVAEAPLLRSLPAGRDDLVFRGEAAARSWPVFVDDADAADITRFQFGLLNTVSVLPERSRLTLSINGRKIADIPASSPQTTSLVSVAIPPGTLVPGFNAVTIGAVLTHRVDCSVAATHELWALLRPAHTGFVVPRRRGAAAPSVESLAGEPVADDGTTRLHLRLADAPSEAVVDRAARFIGSLVRRAHLVRPIVDVGPDTGTGAGLDVVIGRTADLGADAARAALAGVDGVSITRDPTRNRLVVTLAGADDTAIEAAIAAFAARSAAAAAQGSPAGLALLDEDAGLRIEGAQRLTLADLGLGDVSFTGRRFVGRMQIVLPDDAYDGGFAKARLHLEGVHAHDLDDAASLAVRVNGTMASYLSLGPGTPEKLEQNTIDLPLYDFRPGRNEIEIEAVTPSRVDAACDLTQTAESVRLSISGRSVLEFPAFAHMRVSPQLAGSVPLAAQGGAAPLPIYVADASRSSLGSALTLAAARADQAVAIRLAPPAEGEPAGIVVAPLDRLPADLAGAVSRITTAAPDNATNARDATLDAHGNASGPATGEPTGAEPAKAEPLPLAQRWRHWASGGWTKVQSWVIDTGSGEGADLTVPVGAETLVIAAVSPQAMASRLGSVLPHFVDRPDQWVVVTGESAAITHAGIERLVAGHMWPRLAGQAVSLDLASGETHMVLPAERTYAVPNSLRLREIPPIVGGFMSDNIVLSAIVLLAVLLGLGLSTHSLIGRSGNRRS